MPQVAEHPGLDPNESASEILNMPGGAARAPCHRWRRMMLRVEDRKNLRAHRERQHREEL